MVKYGIGLKIFTSESNSKNSTTCYIKQHFKVYFYIFWDIIHKIHKMDGIKILFNENIFMIM